MKQKTQGDLSMPMIALIVVFLLGALAFIKTTMKPQVPQSITSVSELDSASQELDGVDVDGLGQELPQLSTDASTF